MNYFGIHQNIKIIKNSDIRCDKNEFIALILYIYLKYFNNKGSIYIQCVYGKLILTLLR